jgi:glycosyltransferase involved in cell wall biosynthesis
VSIVVSTYNRAALLMAAIASIQAQSFADWDAIVVDDGSTDDTLDRLATLAEPRVRTIVVPHAGSASIARNRGLAQVRGEWTAFLDSDDLWAPEKLMLQLQALERSGVDWCYGDHDLVAPDGRFVPRRAGHFAPLDGTVLAALIREETSASLNTVLVRSAILARLGGFNPAIRMCEDLDFVLRLAAIARAVAIPRVLAHTREHHGRRTLGQPHPFVEPMEVFERIAAHADDREVAAAAQARHEALFAAVIRRDLRRGRPFAAMTSWRSRRRRLRKLADADDRP